jgi:hypothetical protein
MIVGDPVTRFFENAVNAIYRVIIPWDQLEFDAQEIAISEIANFSHPRIWQDGIAAITRRA